MKIYFYYGIILTIKKGDIMRKFIISDIHGHGDLYNSVMAYLENVSKVDDVTLYINGDLIDRGSDSGTILLDLISRINNPNHPFKIVYLGGNHELMMYRVFEKRRKGIYVPNYNDWYHNGGRVTDDSLTNTLNDKEKILEVVNFISNLKIYHKFEETLNNKSIVLVHASSPLNVKDECDIYIKDLNLISDYYVWAREDSSRFPFRCHIGNKHYFSVIGHTPNNKRFGYFYNEQENYLNIDGGCAPYVCGHYQYDHFPLVEVKDHYLKILTFNSNNEIIYGNYFQNNKSIPFTSEELAYERRLLNKQLVPKKILRLEDDMISYKD